MSFYNIKDIANFGNCLGAPGLMLRLYLSSMCYNSSITKRDLLNASGNNIDASIIL